MKKALQIIVAIMALSIVLTMSACSNYNKVKKAFENEGWTVSETLEGLNADLYENQAEEMDIKIKFHVFAKGLSIASILELDCSEEKMEEFLQSETLKGLFKDAQKSDYVNGSCILLPGITGWNDEAVEIFKNA